MGGFAYFRKESAPLNSVSDAAAESTQGRKGQEGASAAK
jgi:hypothetical protein